MEKSGKSLISRLYIYQSERFPFIFLIPTTLAIIFSTYAVLSLNGYNEAIWKYVLLGIAGISFLLHTRVIDELRDKEIDDIHHPERPIQRGLISPREILIIGYLNGGIFITIHLLLDPLSGMLSAGLLIYSLIARYEVGFIKSLKPHFWLYNLIMLIQMLLLQLIAYAAITKTLIWSSSIWWHALGVFILSALIEAARKCLPADEETAYLDSYSSRLGIQGSAFTTFIIGTLAFFCFFFISNVSFLWLCLSLTPLLIGCLWFSAKPNKSGKNIIQLSAVLSYIFLNLTVALCL